MLAGRKLYADGLGTAAEYLVSLTSTPKRGANACMVGSCEAKRGGKPALLDIAGKRRSSGLGRLHPRAQPGRTQNR